MKLTSVTGRFQFSVGKRVGCEGLYPDGISIAHNFAQRFGPIGMTKGSRFSLPFGPAAITVHDHGNMAGNLFKVQFLTGRMGLCRRSGRFGAKDELT